MLMPVERAELLDDGCQRAAPGGQRTTGRHLLDTVADVLELLIEVLDGDRASLVEEAPELCSRVDMPVVPSLGSDKDATAVSALLVQLQISVMLVTQQEPQLQWQFVEQGGHTGVIGARGCGEERGQRDPDITDRTDQMQLPPVDTAVPAELGRGRLRADAAMRHVAGLPILRMLDAATGRQHGAIDGCGACYTQPLCAGKAAGSPAKRCFQVRLIYDQVSDK